MLHTCLALLMTVLVVVAISETSLNAYDDDGMRIKSEYVSKCLQDKHYSYHNLVWDWSLSSRARKEMDKLNSDDSDFYVDGLILLKRVRPNVIVRHFCEDYMHFARTPILKNQPGTIVPNDGNAVGCASKITWENEGRIFCLYKFVYP